MSRALPLLVSVMSALAAPTLNRSGEIIGRRWRRTFDTSQAPRAVRKWRREWPGDRIDNRVGLLITGFLAAEQRASDLQNELDFTKAALDGANRLPDIAKSEAGDIIIKAPGGVEIIVKAQA